MKLEKIKFSELVNDTLSSADLSAIKGGTSDGSEDADGCGSGVCVNSRSVGTQFCDGGAVCTSGIDVCHDQT